jgi:anaerobic selenocysteine-containing dehydrogenase
MIRQMRASVATRLNDQLGHLKIRVIEVHQVLTAAHRVLYHAAISPAHDGRAALSIINLIIEQDAWTNEQCVRDRHQ